MGQSTDAILFFGAVYTEEGEGPWTETIDYYELDESGEEFDSENWLATLYGWAGEPDLEYGDDTRAAFVESWDKKRIVLDGLPMEIKHHCSGGYPMAYVAIKEAHTTAWRGHPQKVETKPPPQEWLKALNAFYEKAGIEQKDRPEFGWYLVSMWN